VPSSITIPRQARICTTSRVNFLDRPLQVDGLIERFLQSMLKPVAQAQRVRGDSLTVLCDSQLLAIRYGHVKFPYREDEERKTERPYVRE
jgi:hypothetical protein